MTFNWKGFLSAMGSNLTFQSRNVLSKKFMTKGEGMPGCCHDSLASQLMCTSAAMTSVARLPPYPLR